jgi:hypothetical protein
MTSSWGGTRKMPFAFTEYGVAMLSSVLRSKRAIQVNIQIMLVFSKIREMLLDSLSMKLDIEEIKRCLNNQDKNLDLVFSLCNSYRTRAFYKILCRKFAYIICQ